VANHGVMTKRVYHFEEGSAAMKRLLGGKGANLAEMTSLGLPIPPGFTITTEACNAYYAGGGKMPDGLFEEVREALKRIEEKKNQRFGDGQNPLLVSVRSGSVLSMPGMMDTILNLGLNDETVLGLAAQSGNERFAFDSYRRFLQMFGNVVLNIPSAQFEKLLDRMKEQLGVRYDQEVPADSLKTLVEQFKSLIRSETGEDFPQDVYRQLYLAIEAVFRSWNNPRAKVYRKAYSIPDDLGTAVNVQSMVFGNLGEDSGTGVLFTRNPSTGEKVLYGEYLTNAQGEDVVAGVRTPKAISELARELPGVYARLQELAGRLEKHYRDMQDIEFTVEKENLYLLQTRNGKRTAQASVKIAVDLMEEGIITREEAVARIEPGHLDQLLHRSIDDSQNLQVIAEGLPASPGAATGRIVFDADTAEQWAKDGEKVILVSPETTPEDIHGVIAAEGVLTSRGGMTSHAAVVARGMGKPCVCGCEALQIDVSARKMSVGQLTLIEGDAVSIDGSTGRVILGTVTLKDPVITPELSKLLEVADSIRHLKVYTNADTPEDAAKARAFGAEGIGLCRTEHMFMSADRLPVVQAMIMADDDEGRRAALDQILPMQQGDFEGIFAAMDGLTVTIRLLDPPLHEFLPDLEELAEKLGTLGPDADAGEKAGIEAMIRKVRSLHEANPMLGLRGCRLGILFPEIYEMQVRAIFQAALNCMRKGIVVKPDIMVPLVGHPKELAPMKEMIDRLAADILGGELDKCPYHVGTMIEVPRAALVAGQIAEIADFFSFGTNDLTQMTFGYSRDDAEGKFLNHYLERNILEANPFQVLDEDGVGQLIRLAVERGKEQKPGLKTGICGEHGGEKQSIFFCHRTGLDYVSCSPFRVPFARIAAAQAALADTSRQTTA